MNSYETGEQKIIASGHGIGLRVGPGLFRVFFAIIQNNSEVLVRGRAFLFLYKKQIEQEHIIEGLNLSAVTAESGIFFF